MEETDALLLVNGLGFLIRWHLLLVSLPGHHDFRLLFVVFKHRHNYFSFELRAVNRGDADVATGLEFGHFGRR